jgi:hypothetical protein
MRLAAAPGNVRISRRLSRLPNDSVVNVSQLFTLDKSLLTEKVSRLPAESLREANLVRPGFQRIMGIRAVFSSPIARSIFLWPKFSVARVFGGA